MRKCLFVTGFLAFALALCAQKKIDSLHQVIRKNAADTITLKALAALAEAYRTSRTDSALLYAQKVMSYPDKPSFNKFKAHASNSAGIAWYYKGQYPQAIEAFQHYYEYSARNNDKQNMAFAINNEGNIYIELGDYGKALDIYKKALQLRQEINDASGIAMSYNVGSPGTELEFAL